MRQSVFVKVSGDLYKSEEFLASLAHLCKSFFVVICVGGGTQINKALGGEPTPHGPLGRELKSFKERQIARDVLEQNQAELQDLLADWRISAVVIIPVLDVGSVLCHINGDTFIELAYLGYDHVYVATTQDRLEEKKKQFAHLPKVKVLGFKP